MLYEDGIEATPARDFLFVGADDPALRRWPGVPGPFVEAYGIYLLLPGAE